MTRYTYYRRHVRNQRSDVTSLQAVAVPTQCCKPLPPPSPFMIIYGMENYLLWLGSIFIISGGEGGDVSVFPFGMIIIWNSPMYPGHNKQPSPSQHCSLLHNNTAPPPPQGSPGCTHQRGESYTFKRLK